MKAKRYLFLLILFFVFIVVGCSFADDPVIVDFIVPSKVAEGDTVNLTVKANNPEDGRLGYAWQASEGEISGSGSSVSYIAPDNISSKSIEVTVIVRNADGGEATVTKEIKISRDRIQINVLSADPSRVSRDNSDQKISIEADIQSYGRDLDYNWEVLDGGDIEKDSQDGSQATYYLPDNPSRGDYRVRLEVSDGFDALRETVTIYVGGAEPKITNIEPAEDSLTMETEESQYFYIEAEADEDFQLQDWEWTLEDDSGFSSQEIESSKDDDKEYIKLLSDNEIRLEPIGLAPGDYIIRIIVEDNTRSTAEQTWNLKLEGDGPQFVDSNIPDQININSEVELEIIAESSFVDDNDLEYNWDVVEGSIDGSGSLVTYNAPNETGTEELTIIVSDGSSETEDSEETIEIDIVSEPVVINRVYAQNDRIKLNEDTRITVDYEADTFNNRYRWRIIDGPNDDDDQIEGDGEQVEFSPQEAGEYTVEIRVIDREGDYDTTSKDIIVEYLDPVVKDSDFEEVIKRNKSSQLILNEVENPNPDADESDLDYDWYIYRGDDNYINGEEKEAIFNPEEEVEPGIYDVKVQVIYGSGIAQAAITEAFAIKVESLDPQVTENLNLSSTKIYNDGSIDGDIEVENPNPDASEDDLDYKWMLDGEEIDSQYLEGSRNSITYQPDGSISAGTHELEVVISDEQGGRIKELVEFEVENRPPEITDVDLSPSSIQSDSSTRISVDVENPDGDELSYTYKWAASDEEGVIADNTESDTITYEPKSEALTNNGLVIKGEHTITVIVNDGSDGQDNKEEKIEVINTPPNIENFFVDEGKSILGFEDTVELRVDANDIDDDNSDLKYEWDTTEGEISGSGSRVNYTAGENDTTDQIRVTVSDSEDETDSEIELEIKDIWQQTLEKEKITGIIEKNLGGGYKVVTINGQLLELDNSGKVDATISLDESAPDVLNDIVSFNDGWFVAGKVDSDGYYGDDEESSYLIDEPEVRGLTGNRFGDYLILVGESDGQGYVWTNVEDDDSWEQSYSSVNRIEGITREGNNYVLVAEDKIIQVDESGDEFNSINYNGIDKFRDIEAIGGGYLVVGEKNGSAYVAKLDDSFNKIWEKELDGDILTSAVEYDDYYILVGEASNDAYIVKIDDKGNTGQMK